MERNDRRDRNVNGRRRKRQEINMYIVGSLYIIITINSAKLVCFRMYSLIVSSSNKFKVLWTTDVLSVVIHFTCM
jgi:hypothetical protein